MEKVSEQEYDSFLAYAATFYANLGTYHSFGNNKFIPDLEKDKFWDIFWTNPEYKHNGFYKHTLDQLIPEIEDVVFATEGVFATINYPDKGVTAYFSWNMVEEDH